MNILKKIQLWNPFTPKPIQYNKEYQIYKNNIAKIRPNTSINDLDFIVIDSESTGLDTKNDTLVSIALLPTTNNTIFIDKLYSSLIPTSKISNSSEIHGLLHTATEHDIYDILHKIYQYISNKIIVGHYISFDVIMIEKLGASYGFGRILNPIIDTATLAQRLDYTTRPEYINHDDYTLDSLCNKYDILTKARHTAEGDTFITAMLLLKLLHHFKARGITDWKGISKKW